MCPNWTTLEEIARALARPSGSQRTYTLRLVAGGKTMRPLQSTLGPLFMGMVALIAGCGSDSSSAKLDPNLPWYGNNRTTLDSFMEANGKNSSGSSSRHAARCRQSMRWIHSSAPQGYRAEPTANITAGRA